jgi:copper resistance protein C
MHTRTRLAGLLLAVVATALAVVTTALPASAHAELVSSSPGTGATLQTVPRVVTLTFSEPVRTPAFVEVTGPGGANLATGDVRIVDAEVSQRLGGSAEPGRYALSYRITSADGHAISGTVPFSLEGGAAGAPAGPAETTAPPQDASATPADEAPTTPAEESAAPVAGDESGGGMGTGQLLLLLGLLAVGLLALAYGTRRALRHSVTMVEERRGTRSPRR